MNLTVREKKIVENLHDFLNNKPILEDNFSIFEYFKNKDYLSAVFYGIFIDEKISKKYLKIKDTKIETTGFDLKAEGFSEGKFFSEIQNALLREKLNNGLKNKQEELKFIQKNYKNKP